MTDEPEVEPTPKRSRARKKTMPKSASQRRRLVHQDPDAVPAKDPGKPVPPVEPAPSPVKAAPPQMRMVTLRNRRGHLLTPSVLSEDGAPETLRIPAYGRVEIPEDRITAYTRDLVAQGHLSVDPR